MQIWQRKYQNPQEPYEWTQICISSWERLPNLVPITAAEKNMRNDLSNRKPGQEHKSKASATLKL